MNKINHLLQLTLYYLQLPIFYKIKFCYQLL
nr:MAG TPA: hypothetical protein [Bacteriophage sp.]